MQDCSMITLCNSFRALSVLINIKIILFEYYSVRPGCGLRLECGVFQELYAAGHHGSAEEWNGLFLCLPLASKM